MGLIEYLNAYPIVLALAIFVARVMDVSLGTLRTIIVFRGYPFLAALIGFWESVVWLLAAAQVIKNLSDWYLAVAYAAGFGAGNYLGILLESRLAIGREFISAVSFHADGRLARNLREKGFRAIDIDADMGRSGPVDLVTVVAQRRRVPELINLILETDPEALYSVSDVKSVHESGDTLLDVRRGSGWRSLTKRK